MSSFEVIAPGMLTTVQDLGRPGYAYLGVSASGAADALSLRLGNLLVGNPESAAALEVTMIGGTYRFPEGAILAITGSDFGAQLNGEQIPVGKATDAAPNSVLRLSNASSGSRAYLCMRGGIRVPMFLGSASTHLLSGLGGVAGRALRTGDLLRIGREPIMSPRRALRKPTVIPRPKLRVTLGAHAGRFTGEMRELFVSSSYTVTDQANRMGLRLHGAGLRTADPAGVLSQGVSCGSIQVTNAGQPLILFVEQQTTGGYPLIASVITVDLPSVGQLRPGDSVRFEFVGIEEALKLLREQEQWIASGEPFE